MNKTVKNGSESNPQNSLQKGNILNIQFILNDEIVCEYGENIYELVEKLKDDVLDLFLSRIAQFINPAYLTVTKEGEVNVNEIEDYIKDNYYHLRNQLIDIVGENLLGV